METRCLPYIGMVHHVLPPRNLNAASITLMVFSLPPALLCGLCRLRTFRLLFIFLARLGRLQRQECLQYLSGDGCTGAAAVTAVLDKGTNGYAWIVCRCVASKPGV